MAYEGLTAVLMGQCPPRTTAPSQSTKSVLRVGIESQAIACSECIEAHTLNREIRRRPGLFFDNMDVASVLDD